MNGRLPVIVVVFAIVHCMYLLTLTDHLPTNSVGCKGRCRRGSDGAAGSWSTGGQANHCEEA